MDKNLVVTKEHLPQRCEVCHQSDCFDSQTGRCSRCELIVTKRQDKPSKQVSETTALKLVTAAVILSQSIHINKYGLLFIGFSFSAILYLWGIIDLINWFYLKKAQTSPFQTYEKAIRNIALFLMAGACVVQQLMAGEVNILSSVIAAILLVILCLVNFKKIKSKSTLDGL